MPTDRDTQPGYLIPGDRLRLVGGAVLVIEKVQPTTMQGLPSIALTGTEEVSGIRRTVCRPANWFGAADCPRTEPTIIAVNPGLT